MIVGKSFFDDVNMTSNYRAITWVTVWRTRLLCSVVKHWLRMFELVSKFIYYYYNYKVELSHIEEQYSHLYSH